MSKASVLDLVQALSGERADRATCERFYDETLLELGQAPILVTATIVRTGPGLSSDPDASYELPENAITALQYYYDDTVLNPATELELRAWNGDWRGLKGQPLVYVAEDVGSRRFRLVPQPDMETAPYIFITGEPFDTAYPEYGVVVFHTDKRDNLPYWLELPVAHMVLAREFARDSDHQDLPFAARSAKLGVALLEMVR